MKTLKINPQVYDDLEDIREYIALDSEEQADKVIRIILSDMETLISFQYTQTMSISKKSKTI